jgi:hypothetical protein
VDNPDREAVYQVVKEFFDELFSAGADIADGSGRSTRAYMRRLLNKAA